VISQRVEIFKKYGEVRDLLDQRLSLFCIDAGYLPVPIPNVLDDQILRRWLISLQPTAFILSGGNDIGEDQKRDGVEKNLLNYAKDKNCPVLGICRGMQMMTCWAGGTLKPVDGHVASRHSIRGEINGNVNSFHNFSASKCPSGFITLATSDDSEIEAFKHETLPWEGWMWHPERETKYHERDLTRMQNLFA
jgi:putative glutamine amidotransferase